MIVPSDSQTIKYWLPAVKSASEVTFTYVFWAARLPPAKKHSPVNSPKTHLPKIDVFFILVWFYVIELNYRIIRFFEACFRLRSYTNSPQGIPHSVKLILNFGACFVIFLNIMYLLFWLYEKRPTACLWAAAIGLVKVYRSFFAPLCLVYMRNSGKVFLLFRRDILPSFPAFPNQSFSISSTGSPVISAMSFSRYPLAFIALALRSFSFSMPSAKPSARPSFFPSKRPSS